MLYARGQTTATDIDGTLAFETSDTVRTSICSAHPDLVFF